MESLGTVFTPADNPGTETLNRQVATVEKKFEIEKVKPWLDENFVHKVWAEFSTKCIGCRHVHLYALHAIALILLTSVRCQKGTG